MTRMGKETKETETRRENAHLIHVHPFRKKLCLLVVQGCKEECPLFSNVKKGEHSHNVDACSHIKPPNLNQGQDTFSWNDTWHSPLNKTFHCLNPRRTQRFCDPHIQGDSLNDGHL